MSSVAPSFPARRRGEPPWEIAQLFPDQGFWEESDYLALHTKRLVEFDNGMIEVLPMPKKTHQAIVGFLYQLVCAFVAFRAMGGLTLMAGYKIRVGPKQYREPDLIYLTPEQDALACEDFTDQAELVMEVVSPDDPDRDYVTKRQQYASAGIPEYWIVDPARGEILVLRLERGTYVESGKFTAGQQAMSPRWQGLSVAVDAVFAA